MLMVGSHADAGRATTTVHALRTVEMSLSARQLRALQRAAQLPLMVRPHGPDTTPLAGALNILSTAIEATGAETASIRADGEPIRIGLTVAQADALLAAARLGLNVCRRALADDARGRTGLSQALAIHTLAEAIMRARASGGSAR